MSSVFSQDIENKIDPKLSVTEGLQDVVIMIGGMVDLREAKNFQSKNARANFTYNKLRANAKTEQDEVITYLQDKNIEFRSFYIVNMVSAKVDLNTMKELATLGSVSSIVEDGHYQTPKIIPSDESIMTPMATEWGLNMINAPDVWALGYTGQDVVVGGQDTGYKWDHAAIKDQYRGWDGTTEDHDYNWHDAIHSIPNGNPCGADSPFPCDDNNHGTHTMGTMVGDDGGSNQIGVAPGSKWMACRNMDNGNGTLTTYVECFEWFLAPYPVGGTPAMGDPTKSPHVINNSWSCPPSEGCNSSNFAIMELAMNNLRESGVVIVISNGNSGSSCSSTYSPPAFYQNSFSVGATSSADLLANFSSRGPVLYDGSNRLKPEVSAPGVSVRSATKNGGYASFSGTSMAGPHVAGAVALMISANPSLAGQVEKIETILEETAVPITISQVCGSLTGTDIPNNTFGYGRIDVLAAVNRAIDSLYTPFVKVDQFGYVPNGTKIAVISDPITGYNSADALTIPSTIHLKDASTHLSVFSGTATAWQGGIEDTLSGDKVWWFDFSSYDVPGNYYVSLNGERSENFDIEENVYNGPLEAAFKTFYYQRCGHDKASPHCETAYHDGSCHSQDAVCKLITDSTNVSLFKDMSGGWHDAGDYNKYVNYTYDALVNLLTAYEFNPEAWNDNMNIPESGNDIPDLLDEIKYELDWLIKMQDTDGGVFSIVGTRHHRTASPPSTDANTRFYGKKTTAATFTTATVFAYAAREFRKVNTTQAQSYADILEAKAILAYDWGVANPSISYDNTMHDLASSNQEISGYERDMRQLTSAIYLYAITGTSSYKSYVETNYTNSHMMQWSYIYPFEAPTQQSLLFYSFLDDISTSVASAIQNVYRNSIELSGDNIPSLTSNADAYRAYLKEADITWGSNRNKCEKGNTFQSYVHYNLNTSNDQLLRTSMDDFMHYMHGVNPVALSFLTNMEAFGAERSINTIYNLWFKDGDSQWDDNRTSLYGPPPGFISGGPNPGWSLDGCCPSGCGSGNALCVTLDPPSNQPALKSYKDWNTGYPQNSWSITENGIYYQAAYLLLASSRVNTATTILDGSTMIELLSSDIVFDNNSNGLILTSPADNLFLLNVDNAGILSTTSVVSASAQSSQAMNSSLYLHAGAKGFILRSPNNSMWKIAMDAGGNVVTESVATLPSEVLTQQAGDIWINSSDEGLILKDEDNNCFMLQVDDLGKVWTNVVQCLD